MTAPPEAPDPFADALLAARLCAIDPGLGGMVLRGGDVCDEVVAELRAALPPDAPLRRLPVHADEDALFGGLDVGATLGLGRKVERRGLFAEASGGLVVIPMAERLPDATAARIARGLDGGGPLVVALDDGVEDERLPAALAERLAFRVALNSSPARGGGPFASSENGGGAGATLIPGTPPPLRGPPPSAAFPTALRAAGTLGGSARAGEEWSTRPNTPSIPSEVEGRSPSEAEALLDFARDGRTEPAGVSGTGSGHEPHATPAHLTALATLTLALGIDSARAPLLALRAARAAATLAGRAQVSDADITLAARLVLAPRATRIPAPPEADAEPPPPPPPENDGDNDEERGPPDALDDIVLAAALAALPPDLLARLTANATRARANSRARGAGERRKSATHGRPLGARPGKPGGGLRLSLIDTLRAAAPWQKLREDGPARIRIRRDDLRIRRFETRAEALTIFAVDASGSAALARLAEAKGAVELLLAQAYVKRAQVALIAFRGTSADILLPPTRSLTRARRSLAELPGGGGTPLAAGLDAARALAEAAKARGRTPFLVILTDGRANIAADGTADRSAAQADAEAAARAIGLSRIAGAFVDTAPRPRPEGASLAAAMGARYLPLPRADAATMHAAVMEAQG